MARWSERYRHAPSMRDTADSADTTALQSPPGLEMAGCVSRVSSVTVAPSIDARVRTAANDAGVIVPCAWCGTPSPSFTAIINPAGWQCDRCLPSDPSDAAYEAIERQGMIAEGDPALPVLVAMPVSWADASLVPTPGAFCRNCTGRSWWCELDTPRGWRCGTCYPGDHRPAERRREVVT